MIRIASFLALAFLWVSCASFPQSAPARADAQYVRISRSHTSSGDGNSWTLKDGVLSVHRENSVQLPSVPLYQRGLSFEELRSIATSVHTSGLLTMLGAEIHAPPRPDGIVLSDFEIVSFEFRHKKGQAQNSTIRYWSHIDDAARKVIDSVDALLPVEYRFTQPSAPEPNKAPEPTPGLVMPPAEPGVTPSPGVAHL